MAGNVYTLHFKLTDGSEVPVEFIVPQGVSVTGAQINDEGHLIITLSDGNTIDAGEVKGGGGTSNLNLVNGEAEGSLRSVNATPETDEYKLGKAAISVGYGTKARGYCAFSSGVSCIANGYAAHASGFSTLADGDRSKSAGSSTVASGKNASSEGEYTLAWSDNQHVQGKHNITDSKGKYAHIVGNGTDQNNRSNAHTLDWNGNAWFAGDVIVGGKSQDDADAKVLATQEYVDQKVGEIEIPEVPSLDGYATEKYVDDKVGEIKIPEMPEIPAALPNPHALTFSGVVNGSYDGSAPLSVNIPDGVKSWNDLTDKPFGYVVEDGYIVPEKTVAVDLDSGDGLRGFLMTEKLNTPVVGKTYAVKWNGADYNCIAFESDAEEFAGAVLLGNKALITGEISEEPFIFVFGEQDMDGVTVYCTGLVLDGSESVTFSIYGEMEYAKQLDPAFIPEDYINSLIDAKIAAMMQNNT